MHHDYRNDKKIFKKTNSKKTMFQAMSHSIPSFIHKKIKNSIKYTYKTHKNSLVDDDYDKIAKSKLSSD